MSREQDIRSVCEQVLEASLDINQETHYAWCPFCSEMKRGPDHISEINHSQDCAYLIAKDLTADHDQ